MLKRYLEIMAHGGTISQVEIARRLGVPLGMLAEITGQLIRLGYLQEQDLSSCSSECGDCSSSSGCLASGIHKGWYLTEKGRKALA